MVVICDDVLENEKIIKSLYRKMKVNDSREKNKMDVDR